MKSQKVLLILTAISLILASGLAPAINAQAGGPSSTWVTDPTVKSGSNEQSFNAVSMDVANLPSTSPLSGSALDKLQKLVPPQDLSVDAGTFAQMKSDAANISVPNSANTQKFSDAGNASNRNIGSGVPAISTPPTDHVYSGPTMGNWYPGDPSIAVGPTSILICVNGAIVGYDKSGNLLYNKAMTTWWGNSLTDGYGLIFNPSCKYDAIKNRFIVVAVLQNPSPLVSKYMVSISQNSNIYKWYNYSFNAMLDGSTKTSNFAAFPDVGIDRNALFITSNQYNGSMVFQYSKIRVFQKSLLYNGSTPGWTDFYNFTNVTTNKLAFAVRAALALDDPGSSANYYAYFVDSEPTGGSQLQFFRITTFQNWGTPVFSRAAHSSPVSTYKLQPNAVQMGSTVQIPTGDNRLYNLVQRDGVLWTTHTIAAASASKTVSGIRWYELDPVGAAEIQEGTFVSSSNGYYYYPVITASSNKTIGIAFGYSSATNYPSMSFTGSQTAEADGFLDTPNFFFFGQGSRPNNQKRWGSYGGAAIDPTSHEMWFIEMFPGVSNMSWATKYISTHFN